jgi:DNA replication protein DnaC
MKAAFTVVAVELTALSQVELEREVRSIAYHMKAARFPVYREFAGFDFASSEVNEALVNQLHRFEFIEGANNIVLVGGPGTGTSHLATVFGVQEVGASSQEGALLLYRRTRQCP